MRWENILEAVEDRLTIKNRSNEKFLISEQPEVYGAREVIEFESPNGLLRLEHITKPKVVEKRTVYTKRLSSETKEELVYSSEEFTEQINLYVFRDGAWSMMDYKTLFQ